MTEKTMPQERDLFSHLEAVVGSIRQDIRAPLIFHAQQAAGGHFSCAALCFITLEWLGNLRFKSGSKTERAAKFIRGYFPDRYKDKEDLLVRMWRNGLIHERDPKHYEISSGGKARELHWSINNGAEEHNRAQHLRCIKRLQLKGEPEAYVFNVNLFQLAEDLEAAARSFIQELIKNSDLRCLVLANFADRGSPKQPKGQEKKWVEAVIDQHDPDEFLGPFNWVLKWSDL